MARSHKPAPSGTEASERDHTAPRAHGRSDPGLGHTGPGGLSLGAVHSLQGLAGNAAVGDVTLPNGTVLQNVPKWVEIEAGPTTSGPVPTLPQRDEAPELQPQ
jgi:hypothetical protein